MNDKAFFSLIYAAMSAVCPPSASQLGFKVFTAVISASISAIVLVDIISKKCCPAVTLAKTKETVGEVIFQKKQICPPSASQFGFKVFTAVISASIFAIVLISKKKRCVVQQPLLEETGISLEQQ